jgi:TetR/AcrR family transcriptional repressor of nem operon
MFVTNYLMAEGAKGGNAGTNRMGRKREFNYNRAVERATQVFWAKGYTTASMRDLLRAMGIGEGSFYHIFVSKNRLYLECMKHYNETVTRRRLATLEAEPSVRKGIRKFFGGLLNDLDDPKIPAVCLMSRSLSSDVCGEAELQSYVKASMDLFEGAISARLEKAKKTGELPEDFPAELSAQVIFTFLQGYFRVVKTLKPREQMWPQIEALLAGLGL